jgi:iron complex outermembrane receptor protein
LTTILARSYKGVKAFKSIELPILSRPPPEAKKEVSMGHPKHASRPATLVALLVLASVAWPAPARAQQAGGQVAGTVHDATGAAVRGATVTVVDAAGRKHVATTGDAGEYAATGVAPGVATVTVTLPGFLAASRSGLEVAAGGTARADFTLETGKREEEITVTAMKTRTETVHDTPLSVVAMSDEVLQERGAEDLEDVAANVAGFTVQNLGPGQSQVAIRGISAGQIVRDQPGVKEQVGVYLDESVVSLSLFTPDMDLFDVSRIEVLRGPQGTLFGSGSLSGTVRYITKQPELGVQRWFGEIGGSTLSEGSQGGVAKLGFNAPLGQKAALRVAGYYNALAGYIDAVQPGLTVDEDVNTGYRSGVRAAISFAPSERLVVTPRVLYQKVKMDGWNRVDAYNILANPFTTTRPAVTLGERQEFSQLDETFTDEFALADLTVSYNFGRVGLTSITSYVDRDVRVIRDATSLTGSVTGGSIGLPEEVYTLDSPLIDTTKAKLFTQELRLSGGGDRLSWVAGGFYSHTDRDYGQDLPTTGFTALSGIPTQGLRAPEDSLFWSSLGYQLDQFALFGEATYSLTDALSLTAGLRYYNFSEDKEQVFDGIFAHDNTGTAVVSQPGSTDADGLAPRLILTYKVSESTNLNAQVARGFRLGGVNDPLNVPLCTAEDLVTFGGRETWKDETVWNYEVGSKSRILGNRGNLNVAAFYMDVSDLQATVTAGSCSSRLIFNVPEARTRGFEAEFALAPTRSFDFAVSASYNDSELGSTVPPVSATGIEEGRRLPTVPEFQLAAAATYQREMGQDLLGYVTGTFQHVGSRYTQVADPDLGTLDLLSFGANTIGAPLTATTFTYDPLLPSYDIVNLRVGVRRERWDVALYANNLTDERALLSFDRERGTRARIFYLTNQPRAFGVEMRVAF